MSAVSEQKKMANQYKKCIQQVDADLPPAAPGAQRLRAGRAALPDHARAYSAEASASGGPAAKAGRSASTLLLVFIMVDRDLRARSCLIFIREAGNAGSY